MAVFGFTFLQIRLLMFNYDTYVTTVSAFVLKCKFEPLHLIISGYFILHLFDSFSWFTDCDFSYKAYDATIYKIVKTSSNLTNYNS